MEIILLIIASLIVVFLIAILVKAMLFRPKSVSVPPSQEITVDETLAVTHLQEMIRCKTVSHSDRALQDEAEFVKFRSLLPKLYPVIHKNCEYELIGDCGMLYRWKGKKSEKPTVLMSHYDVVPADAEAWKKPPFDAVQENGVLWGRGTLDTKTTLLGVMEASEALMNEGFVPEQDIYFSFSGNEEVAGDGAPRIVDEMERRGIVPGLVVDEGGAVVEGIFPGVKESCALIGIGEKGIMDLEFHMVASGGHASAPPPHGPVGILAKAVVDIENHPFPYHLTPPVAEMFDTLGRYSSFFYRLIFANLWCFKPILNLLCKKSGGEMNALLRTTCAFTQMEGSDAANVLPTRAKVVANLRIMGGDTTDSAIDHLKGIMKNDAITLNKIHGSDPSIFSDTSSEGWGRLTTAIRQTWPEAIVSPYLMIAASDSRHYNRISDKVMRFSAMALDSAERKLIHGNDERIPVEKIVRTVKLYKRLIMLS